MAKKTTQEGFNNTDIGLAPYSPDVNISDDIQRSLAQPLVWDSNSKLWRKQIGDSDGRIYVSTSPTQTATAVNSAVSVTTSSTPVLSVNPIRKQFILQNLGASDVYITFGSPSVATQGYRLASGASYADNVYTGVITARTLTGTGDLRVTEM